MEWRKEGNEWVLAHPWVPPAESEAQGVDGGGGLMGPDEEGEGEIQEEKERESE